MPYNDITPRVGVAYDLFGNGKTALKFNWGSYLAYAANDSPYTSTNPGFTVIRDVAEPRLERHRSRPVATATSWSTATCRTRPANGECAAATGTAANFGRARRGDAGRSRRAAAAGACGPATASTRSRCSSR